METRHTLFTVPAGAIIDTHKGLMCVTEPNGCRYLIKRVKVATLDPAATVTMSALLTPPPNPA